ncbi:hypothetical protein A5722_32350 [Mycobacterium vulneris]|nr:hypothetical protein A5722_32350 [Mycolicibacterium vulneris]OCB67822.1 hypothetical protein A5729_06760 [Mycolicibacterium vulneris]
MAKFDVIALIDRAEIIAEAPPAYSTGIIVGSLDGTLHRGGRLGREVTQISECGWGRQGQHRIQPVGRLIAAFYFTIIGLLRPFHRRQNVVVPESGVGGLLSVSGGMLEVEGELSGHLHSQMGVRGFDERSEADFTCGQVVDWYTWLVWHLSFRRRLRCGRWWLVGQDSEHHSFPRPHVNEPAAGVVASAKAVTCGGDQVLSESRLNGVVFDARIGG